MVGAGLAVGNFYPAHSYKECAGHMLCLTVCESQIFVTDSVKDIVLHQSAVLDFLHL